MFVGAVNPCQSYSSPGGLRAYFPDELGLALQGNLYPFPMKGDFLIPSVREIEFIPQIREYWTTRMNALFSQGNDDSNELSNLGRDLIEKVIQEKFIGKFGRIAIEVNLMRLGNRVDLRQKSQLKAQAIAQYVRQAFDLPFQSVVSLGLGADAMPDKMSPYRDNDQLDEVKIYLLKNTNQSMASQ